MARLFINGTLRDAQPATSDFAATGPVTIGRDMYGAALGSYFKGSIDNVQVYQRAVTGPDVVLLYDGGNGRVADKALWMDPALVRTTQPRLPVTVTDPDSGTQLNTDYEVRGLPSETAGVVTSGSSGPVTTGGNTDWQVPSATMVNGSTYFWRARSKDELNVYGPWSDFQAVKVDTAAPATPTVASTQYPSQQWGGVVGTAGTFDFSDTSMETEEFRWTADGSNQPAATAAGSGPRTASVTWTPPADMFHTLQLRAVDRAGNSSAAVDYQLWVAPTINRFAHWKFNETSGTVAADSGNGVSQQSTTVPANLTGSVAFGVGHVGGSNGLVFSGNGEATTAVPVLDTTKAFTVMAWVNPSDLSADRTMISLDGTTSSRMQLYFDKDANAATGGWCVAMRPTDGGTPVSACAAHGSVAPGIGLWQHIALVYNPALLADQLRIFVMGDPQSCSEPAPETASVDFSGTWSATGSFVIGRAKSGSVATEYWRGGIDDVRAHQKALSGTEICEHAQP